MSDAKDGYGGRLGRVADSREGSAGDIRIRNAIARPPRFQSTGRGAESRSRALRRPPFPAGADARLKDRASAPA